MPPGRPSAGGSHMSGVWGREKPRQAFPPQNLRRGCFEPTTWWLSETALTAAPGPALPCCLIVLHLPGHQSLISNACAVVHSMIIATQHIFMRQFISILHAYAWRIITILYYHIIHLCSSLKLYQLCKPQDTKFMFVLAFCNSSWFTTDSMWNFI